MRHEPAVVARLRAAGSVFAEEEAALLTAEAADDAELAVLLERRTAGEPLEVVLGWALFRGLRIAVEPGVFVPRRRTELLAREAVRAASAGAVVVDLCCGTGAVAAAVLAAVPGAEVHAADVDPAATRCARRNLGGAAAVHTGDLYDALPASLRGRVGVLAANAPYVPTAAVGTMPREAREHEALVALDGGADGLDLHRRIASGAASWLAPGGRVMIETSRSQAAGTAALLRGAGLRTRIVHSSALDGTVALGRR